MVLIIQEGTNCVCSFFSRLQYINSLAHGKWGCNFRYVISKDILVTDFLCDYPYMNATGPYWLEVHIGWGNGNQCWQRSTMPYGITEPQWVKRFTCCEHLSKVVDSRSIFWEGEWSSIMWHSMHGSRLASHALNHHTYKYKCKFIIPAYIITLQPEQNDWHLADDDFIYIFLHDKVNFNFIHWHAFLGAQASNDLEWLNFKIGHHCHMPRSQIIHFLPIVILEGKPWGLKMISGVMPLSENGMFSTGHFWLKNQKHHCTFMTSNILSCLSFNNSVTALTALASQQIWRKKIETTIYLQYIFDYFKKHKHISGSE